MPGLMTRAGMAALLLAGVLAGCSREKPADILLRDPAVPVRSIAGFDAGRMVGTWVEAAALIPPGQAPCQGGKLDVSRDTSGGLWFDGAVCMAGQLTPVKGKAVPSGPGRLRIAGQPEEWWVIWADYDMRTVAFAAPSGSFGVVLDRGRIGNDRLRAAREIFAFNGYTVSALR